MITQWFYNKPITLTVKIYVDRMELVYGAKVITQYPIYTYSSERLLIHDIEMASDCLNKAIAKCELGKRSKIRLIMQPQEMIIGGLCDTEIKILDWIAKLAKCQSVEIDVP